MRFRLIFVAQLLVIYFDIVAKRTALPASFAELLRERTKETFSGEISAEPGDLKSHHFFHSEMLEKRHNIRKALMKGGDIEVRGFFVASVQSIEKRMGHFMG